MHNPSHSFTKVTLARQRSVFNNKFRSIDLFGQRFTVKLDGALSLHKSYMGAVLTLLLLTCVFLFTYAKFMSIIQNHEIDIVAALIEDNFTFEDKFTNKDGFWVAFGITNYDNNAEIVEDPTYGELIIEHYGWGYDDSAIRTSSSSLDFHYCSDEELGLNRTENSLAFEMPEHRLNELQTYKKKLKCFDPSQMEIWGDYNSAKAQQLAIRFKMCEGHNYCADKDEIK